MPARAPSVRASSVFPLCQLAGSAPWPLEHLPPTLFLRMSAAVNVWEGENSRRRNSKPSLGGETATSPSRFPWFSDGTPCRDYGVNFLGIPADRLWAGLEPASVPRSWAALPTELNRPGCATVEKRFDSAPIIQRQTKHVCLTGATFSGG